MGIRTQVLTLAMQKIYRQSWLPSATLNLYIHLEHSECDLCFIAEEPGGREAVSP